MYLPAAVSEPLRSYDELYRQAMAHSRAVKDAHRAGADTSSAAKAHRRAVDALLGLRARAGVAGGEALRTAIAVVTWQMTDCEYLELTIGKDRVGPRAELTGVKLRSHRYMTDAPHSDAVRRAARLFTDVAPELSPAIMLHMATAGGGAESMRLTLGPNGVLGARIARVRFGRGAELGRYEMREHPQLHVVRVS